MTGMKMAPLDDWRRDARFFEAGGNRIAYWASSVAIGGAPGRAKPWLLLIHGFPTSSWDWTPMRAALEKQFNIAALDMLGFGLSAKPGNIQYRIVDQANLQEALLEKLGVAEAHLLVHDYGVTVGQELLARHNEGSLRFAIKSICFLNGGLFPEQHRALPVQKLGLTPFGAMLGVLMSRRTLRKNLDAIFGPETKACDQEIDGHWALMRNNNGHRILHKLLQYIPDRLENRDRWVGALCAAAMPMRLINGGADPVSGKHLYDYYLKMLPGRDAVLFDHIGHYPHTEAPREVLDAFVEFHRRADKPLR